MKSRPKTAVTFRDEFLLHDTGIGHPENKGRLESILSGLQRFSHDEIVWDRDFSPATKEQISLIHKKAYIDLVENACDSRPFGYFDADTPFSSFSFRAASLAAVSGIHLADRILAGEIRNGFALVRPPGHHAEANHSQGFCFFNNVAVTAKYLQSKGIGKVFILDWDVHHGNGTQHQFYEDDSVYFASFHQYPFYPGTGSADEIGSGKGKGYNLNFPLSRSSEEFDYVKLWPSLQKEIERFSPDFILISAGFDAHKDDPLGGMRLSTSSFEMLTRKIKKEAEDICQGRIISFLEGGYDFAALSDSVYAHIGVLSS